MKILKMPVAPGEERILEIGGHLISLQEIKFALNIVMLFLIAALAYNYGQHDALEYLKWISAHAPLCDASGQCQSCFVQQSGNTVNWICEYANKTAIETPRKFNIS